MINNWWIGALQTFFDFSIIEWSQWIFQLPASFICNHNLANWIFHSLISVFDNEELWPTFAPTTERTFTTTRQRFADPDITTLQPQITPPWSDSGADSSNTEFGPNNKGKSLFSKELHFTLNCWSSISVSWLTFFSWTSFLSFQLRLLMINNNQEFQQVSLTSLIRIFC